MSNILLYRNGTSNWGLGWLFQISS